MRTSIHNMLWAVLIMVSGVQNPSTFGFERHVPAQYATIQAAINASGSGDHVVIADGEYTGTGNKNLDFGGRLITVRSASGNPDACVINCEGSGRGFYFQTAETSAAVVEGLTIYNGSRDDGGGICCRNNSNPTIRNCIIRGNRAYTGDGSGGGVFCANSSPTLIDCTIRNNVSDNGGGVYCRNYCGTTLINCSINSNRAYDYAGGVFCENNSSITLSHCVIRGNNSLNCGGMLCSVSNVILDHCEISENTARLDGGGIMCENDAAPIFNDCTISGNVAENGAGALALSGDLEFNHCRFSENAASEYGGGVHCADVGNMTFNNCLVTANSAVSGGSGVSCSSGNLSFINCAIVGNHTAHSIDCSGGGLTFTNCTIYDKHALGAVISRNLCTPAFENCIIWNSLESSVAAEPDSLPLIRYSDVRGGWPGDGNFDLDPLLTPDGHVCSGSPCIEAADPEGSYAGQTDVDGESRLIGDRADVGADEWLDVDDDGLPNWWEISFFNDPLAADPLADEDADGRLNWMEYRDGTNPLREPRVFYVNLAGQDDWDGLAPNWDGLHGPKATIQAALDATDSVEGDQVVLADGIYTGTGNKDLDFRGKAITVGSAGGNPDACVIDCRNSGRGFYFHSGETHAAVVTGLTIKNGNPYGGAASSSGAGIYCSGASPSIINNVITHNRCMSGDYGGGIYITSCSSPIIANNRITHNMMFGGGAGLCLNSSSPLIINNTIIGNISLEDRGGGLFLDNASPTIANNTIASNGAFHGGGLYLENSSPTLLNNTIVTNDSYLGAGLYLKSSAPTIANSIIAFNSSGIYRIDGDDDPVLRYNCIFGNALFDFDGLPDPTGTDGNISVDPLLADRSFSNQHIQSTSPCVNAGANADVLGDFDIDGQPRIQPPGGIVDIGADESDGTDWPSGPYIIVRVSPNGNDAHDGSSWQLAKQSIQAAIDAASARGGEVWVQAGTYLNPITLYPHVYLYGGFAGDEMNRHDRDWNANVTVIDANLLGSPVCIEAGYRVGALDGFTITNGRMEGDGGGVGVHCDCASPVVSNNVIHGNLGEWGGGVFIQACSPLIAHNTIKDNIAWWTGGGICSKFASPTIVDNLIFGNSVRCFYGGGVSMSGLRATFVNNTIIGNTDYYHSCGGLVFNCSDSTVANNIIAFNSSGIQWYDDEQTSTLRYNCVFGNVAYNYSGIDDPTGLNGNISADPSFWRIPDDGGDGWCDDPGTPDIDEGANDDFGDLRLLPDSPCIDAADNTSVPPDVFDLDDDGDVAEPQPYDLAGRVRFIDDPYVIDTGLPGTPPLPVIDMGAYELCIGDLDDNGTVDLSDLAELLGNYGLSPAAYLDGDLDADGDIDLSDLAALLGVYGRDCSGD